MNNNNYFPLERNKYFYGKMLTARDFEVEQNYFNNKRRIINRTILGTGVVCGLGVYRNDDSSFSLETGLALDYMGREIVVPAPVIRKLSMVEGAEKIDKQDQAFLCLQYAQTDIEPVNSIGASDSESRRFNKTEESFRLYLSTDTPNFAEIYGGGGINTVGVVYNSHGLCIVRVVPKLALAGDEVEIKFIVSKGIDSQPVSFSYDFESEYFGQKDGEKKLSLSFNESAEQKESIIVRTFALKAAYISETAVPLSKNGGAISVRMGDFSETVNIDDNPDIYLCESPESYAVMRDTRMSTLEKNMSGENTPIYLAKIDCLNIGTGFIIKHITSLPFGQRVVLGAQTGVSVPSAAPAAEIQAPTALAKPDSPLKGGVITEVETLDYWQKPQVTASYSRSKGSLSFKFGIPSTEAYDYATSSGVVDIPISGAIRVNSRFVSEEIPHNLGLGNVCISVSVEYNDGQDRRLLFGSGDVFSGKNESKAVPKIDSAAILYPDRGSFKVGIIMRDYVEGHSVRVRWFAYKPTRDTAALRTGGNVTVKIIPDIQKLKPLERVNFKAEVEGAQDKGVIWAVKDSDGGKIDDNGLYQAPSTPGTYEITAQSRENEDCRTSAFVIVEE